MLEKLRPGTRRAKLWLSISVGLLCLQLIAFLLSQAALLDFYSSNTAEVSDNQTWVVSQLEVDFQTLENRLLQSELDAASHPDEIVPQDSWSETIMAFDIYYSRVDTTQSQLAVLKAKGDLPARFSNHLQQIRENRDELARLIDASEVPDREFVQRLLTLLAPVADPIRTMALDTLFALSEQADADRQAAQNYFLFHITVAALTVALLVTASITILIMLAETRKQNVNLETILSLQDRLFRQIQQVFVLTDAEGNILRANHAFEKLLGWSEDDIKGRELWGILPEKRRAAWLSWRTSAKQPDLGPNNSVTIREIAMTKKGHKLPVELSIMHLQNAGDTIYLIMIRSIQVEQKAMRALRRDRSEARKWAYQNSRILSVMSHEMRTPLHGVISALDLVQRQELAPATRELIRVAQNASETATKYADQALDLAKVEFDPQNVKQAVFSPAKVVHQVVEMLRQAASAQGNEIHTEVGAGADSFVLGYSELVRHSLTNLVGNAIKFTAEGEIRVRLSVSEEKDQLKIEVGDTGIGISEKRKEEIFQEYVTHSENGQTNLRGTGLGLSLFTRAVSRMGGDWGLSSELDQGSTFWFTFPVEAIDAATDQTDDTANEAQETLSNTFRVLAVDDNAINLGLLSKMLIELGLPHELAQSGNEAITKASQTCFDVILMDISMPDLDGYETTEMIRKEGLSRDATIIAFTADTSVRTSGDLFIATGMNDILVKPVTLETLRKKLRHLDQSDRALATQPTGICHVPVEQIIDHKAVEHLVTVGGLESLLPHINELLHQANSIVTDVEYGSTHDLATLPAKFHSLSGAAGMMGAARLAEVARECEATTRTGTDNLPDILRLFRDVVETTRREFAKLTDKMSEEEKV